MIRSRRRVRFVAVVSLLVGCIPLSGSVQRRPSLMEAARQPVLTFATALAANGVAAGVLVPQSALEEARGTLPGPSERAGNLEAALARFVEQHPEYRAVRRSGALIIRHNNVPEELDRLLQEPSANVQWRDRPALLAAIDVGRQISGKPDRGGGVAGTGPPPDGCPISAPISHGAQKTTVLDLLDSIARQARTLVWVLVFPTAPKVEMNLRLGLVCGNERVYFIEVSRQLAKVLGAPGSTVGRPHW